MNIIEAIKSGKDFFRASNPAKSYRFVDYNNDLIEFSAAELLADDWEVESDAVTITLDKFNTIWDVSVEKCTNLQSWNIIQLHGILVKELGL